MILGERKEILLDVFECFCFLLCLGMFGLLVHVFFTAYGNPDMMVRVYINMFGEAGIESILVPLTFIIGIIGFISYFYRHIYK